MRAEAGPPPLPGDRLKRPFVTVCLMPPATLGAMSQRCCRQVLLAVEASIVVMALVLAGGAGQIHDSRGAGSSCYGGFDLYFVLDK